MSTHQKITKWIYKRGILGDIEVWAHNRLEAAVIIKNLGFHITDINKIVPGVTTRVPSVSTDFDKGIIK